EEGMLRQSERVHNLQRVLNVKMGVWGKEKDQPPYRAMGPVTEEEYLYRKDFYDAMIKNEMDKIPETMKLPEKMAAVREHKQNAYSQLQQMIYKKRGWNEDGIPTVKKLHELGIDDKSVIETVEKALAESSMRQ
ncbi:MAG: aldehyde ferredoxin oxidoreductase C-terminal domain-containing protein, partial [Synergistota bacterium]|nr:aldehyde ferredoxin oxidoreductase C-terminal domain-containing protein [Synergistota bacterium]